MTCGVNLSSLMNTRACRPVIVALATLALLACSGDDAQDSAQNPADTTPPVLSAISPTPGAANVTIAWTTSEPADSQLEFGTSASYGSMSPIDSAMVATHSVSVNGLAAATTYHYRVRSRDAAGNLAISGDATFVTLSTPDTTAPTVALITPAGNTTVSGMVTVEAAAADNVAVAGVQFRLDGANLGAEDTTSPYSVPWDTTGAGNGAHSLSAVARDPGGNVATSAAANVTVSNTSADTTPPTISLTAPTGGATVSGSVTVSATAADDTGVFGVQFLLDGAAMGTEDLAGPYSTAWNSTTASNGSHALAARARDAAGNQTTTTAINVIVNNAPPPNGAAIVPGQVVVDPPTLETLGVALPIGASDTNHNATVQVTYRRAGDPTWLEALPLFRVRPEFIGDVEPTPFTVDRQFAGSIFDLAPDTEYEIMLDIRDPDGGNATRTVTARTRAVPLQNPATPRVVAVSTLSALNSALAAAAPGDVISIADGVYNGAISISNSGTAANPIFVRGASRDGVVINAAGANTGATISGRFVTLENLTIRSASQGIRVTSPANVVLRRLRVTDVSYGIESIGGAKRDHTICDNLLEGREAVWPDNNNSLWLFEGIAVTGAGHVICHNTMSGFGDSLGLHTDTTIPNRAIDFYGNDILWSGDNGVEFDYSERNVRAFRNRFTNSGNHSVSFQPVYGGPVYAIRNVIYNSGTAPFKLNNDPTGFLILHNSALRPGIAWAQYSGRADNFVVRNNIMIGTGSQVVDMSTSFSLAQIDYNGWRPDGTFRYVTTYGSFADLRANSPYEQNGRLLNAMPFATTITIPPNFTTFVSPIDASLSATTNAIDGGVRLPNINDGYSGANPDLGAIERGAAPPHYGVR
jgi:hypothetical protein